LSLCDARHDSTGTTHASSYCICHGRCSTIHRNLHHIKIELHPKINMVTHSHPVSEPDPTLSILTRSKHGCRKSHSSSPQWRTHGKVHILHFTYHEPLLSINSNRKFFNPCKVSLIACESKRILHVQFISIFRNKSGYTKQRRLIIGLRLEIGL